MTMRQAMTIRDPEIAFGEAIASGRLSADESAANHAGLYMYMCTFHGVDQFKHTATRRYLPPRSIDVMRQLRKGLRSLLARIRAAKK